MQSYKLTTGFIRWALVVLAYLILLQCIRKVPGQDVLLEKVVSSTEELEDKKCNNTLKLFCQRRGEYRTRKISRYWMK